ncbi:serine-rich adhesin for platelets [Aplysia californica]|uniref:Serine-rich adhesin for platelets n=1 Tax=Aplysia californica TaxID=6500 RepID=A0ABM0JNB6_APLCA|nr:serine-rich adhesin for platelets [Aplysia californica]XP_005097715.1 serine-rich adhesin for platelets [Aplysia californica]XP_012937581.1 serine-rich adhesin for platelets [Aplysia californica]
MADVASSMSASSPPGGSSGLSLLSDSPDLAIISPGVKEAMDRIFPKSASQLLQQRPSQDGGDGPISSSDVGMGSAESSLFCGLEPSAFGGLTKKGDGIRADPGSVPSESSPAIPQTEPQVTPKTADNGSIQSSEKRPISKLRITKADLEIISSLHSDFDELSNKSYSENSQGKSKENSTNDCYSNDSDSEDMCRPFASVAKAKKKDKKHKKKKRRKEDLNRSDVLNSVITIDSEEEFHKGKRKTRNDINLSEKNLSQRVVIRAFEEDSITSVKEATKRNSTSSRKLSQSLDASPVVQVSSEENSSSMQDLSVSQQSSQNSFPSNWSVSATTSVKDIALASDDVSNISFSSSKENVHSQVRSGIKLPKVRKPFYDVKSDKKRIRNTFPPCCVVLTHLGNISQTCSVEQWSLMDSPTPLSVRLKSLRTLCARGGIKCKHRKKQLKGAAYGNFHDVNNYTGQSEEEFETARGGRSLRKRNQNISYAEPSEFADDLMESGSSRRKSKIKDRSTDRENDSQSESDSSQKKGDSSQNKSESSQKKRKLDPSNMNGEDEKKEQNNKEQKKLVAGKAQHVERKGADGKTQVYVYPSSKLLEKQSKEKSKGRKSDAGTEKSKTLASSHRSLAPVPRSSNVSVLVNSTSQSLQPIQSSVLSPMPLGLSGGLMPLASRPIAPSMFPSSVASTPVVASSTFPMPISTAAAGKPQYCMMKMDGKDVLVQLLPSGMIGPAYSGMQSMVLPGGKRFLLTTPPPSMVAAAGQPRVIGQTILRRAPAPVGVTPIGQPHVVSVASSSGTRFVATSAPMNAAAALADSSGVRSSIPILSSPQLGRITGISVGQAFSLASGSLMATTSFSTAPIPVISSSSSAVVTAASLRDVTSVTSALSSVRPSSAVTSMAAPSSTTVVHSARTPAPSTTRAPVTSSQAVPTSMRSLRVFVPGCSATGTPGHFTTLASVGSGSPLTRLSASSDLLPQRKRSAEKELTAEQKAAKRRKLEKKYPLPPGVVIKTENPDTPSTPTSLKNSSNTNMRSLLRQNVLRQNIVFSTARSGAGGNIQSIRIITPAFASALTNRPVRPGSNIMYRAANVGGRQTVLVPITVGSSGTTSTTGSVMLGLSSSVLSSSTFSSTSTSSTAASQAAITASSIIATSSPSISTLVSNTAITTASSTTATTCTTVVSSAMGAVSTSPPILRRNRGSNSSPLPPVLVPEAAVSSENGRSDSTITSTSSSSCVNDATSEDPAHSDGPSDHVTTPSSGLASTSSRPDTDVSVSCVTGTAAEAPSRATGSTTSNCLTSLPENSVEAGSPSVSLRSGSPAASMGILQSSQAALASLRLLVKAQEANGLKGERMDKLRTLLLQKEELLKSLQKSVLGVEHSGDSSSNAVSSSVDSVVSQDLNGHNGTENDPFVID